MKILVLIFLISLLQVSALRADTPSVVINEIHYNPDVKTELVEFVELYNAGTTDVDISGWYFSDGISYTFPAGSRLPRNGYLVVVQDRTGAVSSVTVASKYGVSSPPTGSGVIYGPFEGKLDNDGEIIKLCSADGLEVDEVEYKLGFPWPTVGDSVPSDTVGNGYSIQLMNPLFDNDLGGSWRSAYPTPAAKNTAVYADNIPPQIRQVKHSPKQPKSNDVVTITAKVTDPDGVKNVTLHYQLVNPGSYIPITLPNYPSTNPATLSNPAYENAANWSNLAMHDDGLNGDAVTGDDIYTVQLPANLQTHRRLLRYRITATDTGARSIRVPYSDDLQPNFVYFVYDEVPAWRGAIQPGITAVVEYSTDVMRSLPVYHLIAREQDVTQSQYNVDTTLYYWSGTLIYDGDVYDNIHYRIRAQYSTFVVGKNKWKLDFNRGRYFQGRDDYGKKYKEKWDKMNVGTGVCPWWKFPHPDGPWDQGTMGMAMNEVLGFRLYRMAGVPAANTNYFHFRIIDGAAEAGPTQYDGDFWGLYITIENPDGHFLNERGLPDGNLYRMEGVPNEKNQGSTQVTDNSDVDSFTSGAIGYNKTGPYQPLSWWQTNVDLETYYSSKAVGVGINDSDRRPQYNCSYYHNPETNKWTMMPWDLDLTYEWGSHYGDWEHFRYVLSYEQCNIAYKNRARELLDLLFNSDQSRQLIDEIASIIGAEYDGKSFIDAERAMWNYNQRMNRKGQFYVNNEFFNQPGRSKDWPNMVEYYKEYLTPTGMSDFLSGSYGVRALIAEADDSAIPYTVTITYIGLVGYPINDLRFKTSSFSDPQGSNTFAAMKWRIAEVNPGSEFVPPPQPQEETIVLIQDGDTWKYFKGTREPSQTSGLWRRLSFSDSSWLQGDAPIGYGESFIATDLSDMRGNYSTLYLRKTFDVADIDSIETLRLDALYDDGINVWINGVNVASDNVSSAELPYNAVTNNRPENHEFTSFTLPDPNSYLVSGTNIIAVQVVNQSLGDSSDCFIDVRLVSQSNVAVELPTTPVNYVREPGKYEIDAVWESDELTTFNSTVGIPASAVKVGSIYRVRCRMKDNTGRWSHWSNPVQFSSLVNW